MRILDPDCVKIPKRVHLTKHWPVKTYSIPSMWRGLRGGEVKMGHGWPLALTLTLSLTAVLCWDVTFADQQLPACQASDFHYEYTECDSQAGRWRVSVPQPDTCIGGAPAPPIRGKGCEFTCESGKFLDIDSEQECVPCPAGSYSLGGGVRFDDWDHVPSGFSVKSEEFNLGLIKKSLGLAGHGVSDTATNCSSAGWVPKGRYISSLAGDCSTSLVYTANLVRAGRVMFEYQYTDDNTLFSFEVQNSQCETVSDRGGNKFPAQTDDGEWRTIKVDLKSGLNVFYWKTVGMASLRGGMTKAVKVKDIEISGVAYTSECTKCRPGSYSTGGASECKECKEDEYSDKGAEMCSPCDSNTQFSKPGSARCTDKPACTVDDYFEMHTPCDDKNKTQVVYKWIEPKRCRDDLSDSVKLPANEEKQACPPCNTGMELKEGKCQFCPENEFSDGTGSCQACPASTAPETGLSYVWWNSLPEDANITANCLALGDYGCTSDDAWIPALDHIHSGKGHDPDAYLVLTLEVAGFKGQEQAVRGKPRAVGDISFVFETMCTRNCTFFFMMQGEVEGTSIIKSWTAKQSKQLYTYSVLSPDPVSFSWAFQKENWIAAENSMDQGVSTVYDMVKIYSVNVTNTLGGGASKCKTCPKGAQDAECIPCPMGHYVDTNTTECLSCPANTVVEGANPWGVESCMECGEGTTAHDNTRCETSCEYKSPDGKEYNFKGISNPRVLQGTRLFTSSGTEYYHVFNISLCAGGLEFPMASCYDNISYVEQGLERLLKAKNGALEAGGLMQAAICRMTIIPPKRGEFEEVMSAQPSSLGDMLVNITTDSSSLNLEERVAEEGFDTEDSELDVHLTYVSNSPTTACQAGRTTIITMRCDISEKGNGTIYLPPKCSDGTCDGCNFHFLWRSRQACPLCKKETYEVIKGECINGKQTVFRQPPKHCIFLDDKKGTTYEQKCSIFPFWLQIALVILALSGMLLCILLVYCWKRNRRLEYKYMKLVEGSSGHELPQAETCAIDEDEMDEDDLDQVAVRDGTGKKFFKRLKLMAGKDNDGMEIIKMDEKEPLT